MKVPKGVCVFSIAISAIFQKLPHLVFHFVSQTQKKYKGKAQWYTKYILWTPQALFRAGSGRNGFNNLYTATPTTQIKLSSANRAWRSQTFSLSSILLAGTLPIHLQNRQCSYKVIFLKIFFNFSSWKNYHQVYVILLENEAYWQ